MLIVATNEPNKYNIENELGVDGDDPKACRPPKLTPEVAKRIIDAVSDGAFFGDAAAYGGVTRQTLHIWMRKGRAQKRGKYHDLVAAIDKARAELKVNITKSIIRAADRDWKAGAHWLAKIDWENYGDKQKVQLEGEVTNEIVVRYDNNWKKHEIEEDDSTGEKPQA